MLLPFLIVPGDPDLDPFLSLERYIKVTLVLQTNISHSCLSLFNYYP